MYLNFLCIVLFSGCLDKCDIIKITILKRLDIKGLEFNLEEFVLVCQP